MNKRLLAPLATVSLAAVGAGLTALFALPAQAHEAPTAPYDAVLHHAHHNTKAKIFERGCTEIGNLAAADKDGWVFNIAPDEFDTTIGMWAKFDTGSGQVTTNIKDGDADTYPHGFANATNKHLAWVVVPAGWTLLDAEAKSVGSKDVDRIVVTHTCAGEGGNTPSPFPSQSPSSTPTPGTPTPGTPTPGTSESPGTSETPGVPGDSPSPSEPGLPVTGAAVTVFASVGLALVVGGAGTIFLVRRRRDLPTEV